MRVLKTVAVLSLIATGSVPPAEAQLPADSGALIVRLGRDTLKVERFVIRDRVIRSESIRRGAEVELQQVDMVLAPDGSLAWGQMRIYKWPLEPMARPIAGSQVYVDGDSTILELTLPPVTRRVAYAGRGNIFNVAAQPFMFTLYAAIAAHAPASVGDSVLSQHMASTLGVRKLVVKRAAADLVTAESSIMGLMRTRIDSARRVTALDGTGSSLNFQGERVGWVNLDSVARSFENMNRRTEASARSHRATVPSLPWLERDWKRTTVVPPNVAGSSLGASFPGIASGEPEQTSPLTLPLIGHWCSVQPWFQPAATRSLRCHRKADGRSSSASRPDSGGPSTTLPTTLLAFQCARAVSRRLWSGSP